MKKKKVSSRMIAFFSPKCNQTMLVFSKAARKAAMMLEGDVRVQSYETQVPIWPNPSRMDTLNTCVLPRFAPSRSRKASIVTRFSFRTVGRRPKQNPTGRVCGASLPFLPVSKRITLSRYRKQRALSIPWAAFR